MQDNYRAFLANLNRAAKQKQASTLVYNTKLIRSSLLLLVNLGYITSFVVLNNRRIEIFLKYDEMNQGVMRVPKAISKPGKRVFITVKQLKLNCRNFNLSNTYQHIVLSTSFGLLSHTAAIKKNIGGEALFIVN